MRLLAAILATAIFATGAHAQSAPVERLSPHEAAKRVEACGIGAATIRFDDLLQSHVLTLAGAGGATDAQLECVDRASGYYDVELPANLQGRFDAIRDARMSELALGIARDWLRERGLLERVPAYTPGETDDAAFVRDVESLCGPMAKGAFASPYGLRTISPDWVGGLGFSPAEAALDALSCVLAVTSVAGYEVALLGNEALAPDE